VSDSNWRANKIYCETLITLLVLCGYIQRTVFVERDFLRAPGPELRVRCVVCRESEDGKGGEPQPFTDREAQRDKDHERGERSHQRSSDRA